MEMGTWTMFCLTWETTSSDVVKVFKDGEEIFQITLTLIDVAEILKISVGNTTCMYFFHIHLLFCFCFIVVS